MPGTPMRRSRCVCSAHWRLTPRVCRCGSAGRPSGRCWPGYSSRAAVPVSAERLVEDVWSGRAGPDAVHPFVSRLRRVLGRDAIPQRRGGYVVDRDLVARGRRRVRRRSGRRAPRAGPRRRRRSRRPARSRAGPLAGGARVLRDSRRRRHPGRRRRGRPARRAAGGGGRGARRRARAARPRRRGRRPARRAGGALPAAGVAGRPAGDGALRGGPPGRRAHRLRALPSGAWPSSSAWTRPRRCAASTRRCWPSRRWAR